MWYYAGGNVGYAESADGLRWRKPPLGVIGQQGRDTNLVVRRDEGEGSPARFRICWRISASSATIVMPTRPAATKWDT